jgi:hypothetical protein
MHIFERRKINNPGEKINIPCKTDQEGYIEQVSEINGTSITIYSQLLLQKRSPSLNKVLVGNESSDDLYKSIIEEGSISLLLKFTNRYCAFVSGYDFKLNQITKYDWFTKDDINKCVERITPFITNDGKFEHELELMVEGRKFMGSVDYINTNMMELWEFKFVDELTDEHFIQLALYMFANLMILRRNNKIREKRGDPVDNTKYKYILYNIKTGEMWEIESSISRLKKMYDLLLEEKSYEMNKEEFIRFNKEIRDGYVQSLPELDFDDFTDDELYDPNEDPIDGFDSE